MSCARHHLGEWARVVAYTRVSTREEAEDGHGLNAQRAQLTAQAAARGWEIIGFCEDKGLSGAGMEGRNELARAISWWSPASPTP
jgi:DNA invertase Pin-like site-specific DNA recombinase